MGAFGDHHVPQIGFSNGSDGDQDGHSFHRCHVHASVSGAHLGAWWGLGPTLNTDHRV